LSDFLLSVVIAAKAPPRELLQLCVASLAALKNASRAELVLVRSGEIPDICPTTLARFASCRMVETPPEGVYAAYNAGIRAAGGTYVLFFGADDIALPDMDRVIDGLATRETQCELVAAACYMQSVGIATPSRRRTSLALRNWCHQGIFYLRSYLLEHPYQVEYRAQADHKMNIDIVSNRRLRFDVSNDLVAYFSAGGVSSMKPDLAFRRDFPVIVAQAYGRPLGALIKLKQRLIDAVLGDPEKRFKSRLRH
jgi:glycosyltransferase involved in cell wall biosynthesis